MVRERSSNAYPTRHGRRTSRIALIAALAAAAFGCPLPYNYSGPGASNSQGSDPSSPSITGTVTVSYSVQGGASGTVADGDSFYAGQTTSVTLSTATANAVIFYTDNGTALSLASLSSAKKINGSSGTLTISRTTSVQSLDIHAVAIGPNMLPSAAVHAIVGVSPYPILSITSNKAAVSEDGGTAILTISSSSAAPASGLTVSLVASGGYDASHVTAPAASGATFTATIQPAMTTTTLSIIGVHNSDHVSQTVTVKIQPDPSPTTTYTVGAPDLASVLIQDDGTYTVTYYPNGGSGSVPTDSNTYLPGATVTVLGNTGGLAKTAYNFTGWNTSVDGTGAPTGTPYTPGQTFIMPSANVTLYAIWKVDALILKTFPSVGASQRPEGIAYDGTWLWIGEVNDVKVYQINPSTGASVSSFPLGAPGSTHALALDGAGQIWTTTFWTAPPVLYRWPTNFGAFDMSLSLPTTMEFPTAMTFDSTNNVIWLVNTNGQPSHFWKLNASTGATLDTWDLAGGTPATVYGLCMDSDPNYLWMGVGNTLSKVSIAGRSVVQSWVIPGVSLIQGVAMVSANTFWIVDGNNKNFQEIQLN